MYGKVNAVHSWTDGTDADGTCVRLGFGGEKQINDQLTGYGHFESQFDAAGSEGSQDGIKTRLAFAGLDYGHDVSFDYGRNYGVAYDVGFYTDVLSEFGGDSCEDTDCFLTTRTSGAATLRTKNLFGAVDGVNLAAQYQGQGTQSGSTATATVSLWVMTISQIPACLQLPLTQPARLMRR
ncbi:TPA: porin [Citrobacter gillenii]